MTHPISVRFRREELVAQLKRDAARARRSTSALIEELVDEGLRSRRHPLVIFRDGPSGRRAALVGGPDVWEVVGGIVGGDVPVEERVQRAVDVFGWPQAQVDAALAYYAEFTDEIDAELAANLADAEAAEDAWRRRHDVLAR